LCLEARSSGYSGNQTALQSQAMIWAGTGDEETELPAFADHNG